MNRWAIVALMPVFATFAARGADVPPAIDVYYAAVDAQTGHGVPLDLAKGKTLLLKAAAAGNTLAMNRLGDMSAQPDGGEAIDLPKAREWYDKSAAGDDAYGCLWSANVADVSVTDAEVKKRYAKAFKVAQERDKNGYDDGTFVMSVFLVKGNGVARNPTLALQALQSASRGGYLPATKELASCYAQGNGVPKDPATAFKLTATAADSGFSVYVMDLGICYDGGIGVPADKAKALELYLKAADRGSPRSMTNAGQMIAAGEAGPADAVRAAALFQKAADLGWPPAMYYLGMAYDTGTGVAKSPGTALTWVKKSAALKNPRAKKYLVDHGIDSP